MGLADWCGWCGIDVAVCCWFDGLDFGCGVRSVCAGGLWVYVVLGCGCVCVVWWLLLVCVAWGLGRLVSGCDGCFAVLIFVVDLLLRVSRQLG